MKYPVLKKQNNSKMCFVCGLQNDFGLHLDPADPDEIEIP